MLQYFSPNFNGLIKGISPGMTRKQLIDFFGKEPENYYSQGEWVTFVDDDILISFGMEDDLSVSMLISNHAIIPDTELPGYLL
jgi:hypothetical protein